MRNVMTRAWEIAKDAVVEFGGKAVEYISGALKMAWAEVKAATNELEGSKFQAVLNKLRRNYDSAEAMILENCYEATYEEFLHKPGAYYGVKITTELGAFDVFVSESQWD